MKYLFLILILGLTACGDSDPATYKFNLDSTIGFYQGEGSLYSVETGEIAIHSMSITKDAKRVKVEYIGGETVVCFYEKTLANPSNVPMVTILGVDERQPNVQKIMFVFDQIGYNREMKVKTYMVRALGVGGSGEDICNSFEARSAFTRTSHLNISE